MRKKTASPIRRVRDSPNIILMRVAESYEFPIRRGLVRRHIIWQVIYLYPHIICFVIFVILLL